MIVVLMAYPNSNHNLRTVNGNDTWMAIGLRKFLKDLSAFKSRLSEV